MKVVSDAGFVESAWREQYQRLASLFAAFLPSLGTLVEIGCGRGQLTFPFSKLVPRCSILAVDSFARPYSSDLIAFRSTLARSSLRKRIRLIVSDHLSWLHSQASSRFDGVFSNEFLPDLDCKETKDFISECFRVLRPGGVTCHGFLSPKGRNSRQKLLIEADSSPEWSKFPPKEWFSPRPGFVALALRKTGFSKVRISTIGSALVLKSSAARKLLRSWDVKEAFWRTYQPQLRGEGLEVPEWIVVAAVNEI